MCSSLTKDLPSVHDGDVEVLEREIRTCANILKILSQELYHVDGYLSFLPHFALEFNLFHFLLFL